MNILGLDLSLTSTGYSVHEQTGIFSTKEKGAKRLSVITEMVVDFCLKNNIECVVIEGYSFASRNSQAHSIGEMGGCVRMRLWENKIPFIEVPPTSRAKFATGKGNAGKTEVISSISSKTGKVFLGSGADDMCDAWVLREMALAHLKISQYNWPQVNLSALEKIDWSPLEGINEQSK
jgi:crossover junction endodeoxyribonuclease RuvC